MIDGKDYLVFATKPSTDFGIYAADCADKFSGAQRRVESVEIPGRNGNLTVSDGAYNNVTRKYLMYVKGDIVSRIRDFRNFLNINPGYQRLEDTFTPEEFRLAQFSSLFEVQTSDRKTAAFEIEFECKPQRFLRSGEQKVILTESGQIVNPSYQTSTPLVRVYGTGTVTIGDILIAIKSASSYTDIDCEAESAYKGSTDCNSNIVLTDGKFWKLESGRNAVTLGTGISRVVITPKWWHL